MEVNQLTTNGFLVTEVFSPELLTEIVTLTDTFTPTTVRQFPPSKREVKIAPFELRSCIMKEIGSTIRQLTTDYARISGTELWRDYPGYQNAQHKDHYIAQNVMIVYLDTAPSMGTFFLEDNQKYVAEYRKNTGLILLNSDQIEHGMVGEVAGVDYRRVLYLNWITRKREKYISEMNLAK
jgi:hypothetical protein